MLTRFAAGGRANGLPSAVRTVSYDPTASHQLGGVIVRRSVFITVTSIMVALVVSLLGVTPAQADTTGTGSRRPGRTTRWRSRTATTP